MRISKLYLSTASVLIVWIVLAWMLGSWMKRTGTDLWLLRGGLILLGIIGAAGFLWLRRREPQAGDAGSAQGLTEVDAAFREADARLQSPALGAEGKISHLSCLLIAGEEKSAKTSIAIHSGLEPELLAGQVFRERDVIPTRGVNVWYARKNVLVEAGGALLSDAGNRAQLIRRCMPARLGSVFGRGEQASRAVLLCVDCENLLKPGGAEASIAAARQFNSWLTDLAQKLGSRLPVYVLFTKMDRIPHFQEYVSSLSAEEASQVLGATLPMTQAGDSGIYREAETNRLSAEFDLLYRSLCDRRPEHLSREHNAEKLPSVYEFPREFRKLRSLAVEFLVETFRPSHLRASPLLRGFYFTGVRPVVVADVAVEPQIPAAPQRAELGATRVFVPGSLPAASAPRGPAQSRRVPQWVFLNHLFSDVILKDQAAQRSSSVSSKVGLGRRLVLASATALALVFATGWTVAWIGNRSLVRDVVETARVLPVVDPGQTPSPTLQDLDRLDKQRRALEKLSAWQRNGAPMSLRWGLFAGESLYPGAYRAYFETFRRMLLRPTQDTLSRFMVRPANAELQGYRPVYDALKAYLITTSNPDKSTQAFLAPVLTEHWQSRNAADPERLALVQRQFSFYAGELPYQNPFPGSTPDQAAVGSARAYLARFAATEAIYSAMVSAAGSANPAFDFNRAYPGSAEVVVNTFLVPGAFTREGWSFMQKAIQRPDDYFQGEAWVLGPQTLGALDRAQLQRDLQTNYRADFVRQWREFLQRTSVVRFASVPDAAAKLTKLSSNQSALLAAICAVSRNTSVDDPEITKMFQAAQQVEPATCNERLASPGNAAYVSNLIQLQAAIQLLADNRNDPGAQSQATSAASAALVTVRQMASQFPVDAPGGANQPGASAKTQSLLEDPIKYAQAWVAGIPREGVNSSVQGFCSQFRGLISKYPFDPKATNRATQGEFDAIFKPADGALWRLYMSTLNRFLTKQGNEYAVNPGGGMTVTPQFLSFFNRAAAVSDAFYRGGSATASVNFSLRPVPSEAVVQEITLLINGKTATFRNGRGDAQQFAWPGAGAQEVKLKVRFAGGSEFDMITYSEPWAAFRFFSGAERWQATGNQQSMEWTARSTTGPMIIGGHPATVRFVLDMLGAPPVFQPGFWSGMTCPGAAVR